MVTKNLTHNNSGVLRVFFLFGFALLLQSCFVAKDYERPVVVDEAHFRTDRLPADSSSLGDLSWREFFKDAQLVKHIERALENNIDIRVALEQLEIANAYYRQGKAGYLPTLSARGQVNHQELSANSQFGSLFNGSITQYELTATMAWEADIWGKIRSAKRASQAAYLQTEAAHQAVKTQLIATVATTYYQLVTLDAQLMLVEKTLENRTNSLETTKALKDAGLVTEVAVKQTEAQLYTAQLLKIDILRNIALTENMFSIILGDSPQQLERSSLKDQIMPVELQTGYPASLLSNRPDVRAAEFRLMEAFELTNVARSQFYPSLSISATSGFQSLEADLLINPNSIFANFLGALTQPIFNGRRIRTEYEASRSRQEIAFLQFKQALLTASREVSDALYTHQAAVDKIEIKNKEFEAYTLAVEYSEELLNYGLANYLEVLSARENTLNAGVQMNQLKFEKLQAVVELYRALGGGRE